jgi:hypothetical protein
VSINSCPALERRWSCPDEHGARRHCFLPTVGISEAEASRGHIEVRSDLSLSFIGKGDSEER